YVCLWSPAWSTGGASAAEAGPQLSELAPRIRVEPEVIWADGSGLDAVTLAARLLGHLTTRGVPARAGVAALPVTAELAARFGDQGDDHLEEPTPFLVKERSGWGWRQPGTGNGDERGSPTSVLAVRKGEEARWQAPLPIAILAPDDRLRTLLDGVGITTLGALAALDREAIEVRFGPAAVDLWRLARADDRRILFRRVPPDRPCGSIDFVDYVLTDPARLLFTVNALLGPLCERMVARGEHARTLRLVLPLADGSEWDRVIRPARPTASRDSWLRLLRNLLDRLTVPDAVAGMRLELGRTEPAAVRQGDLFDRGFATAAAVEAAVARLVERQVEPLAPRTDAHPLLERRGTWALVPPDRIAAPTPTSPTPPSRGGGGEGGRGGLVLQLLPEPRRLVVETVRRRDHDVPLRLRDRGGWREIAHAAGPDRISGGQWEGEPYAREYFRCVTDEGVPLWIYRDAREDGWFLHGWWD
ncbi:MAG: hypothetical protein KY466_13840, partial [Gemmatimonadetes bacterium]|nr:hypothetical protein [Gemmatimonadota bacterium]